MSLQRSQAEISGHVIAHAKEIAREVGLQMEFSEGWLRGFRDRYIKLEKLRREKQDADMAGGKEWVKNVLLGLLERYKKRDIFIVTGPSFRIAPLLTHPRKFLQRESFGLEEKEGATHNPVGRQHDGV